MVAAQPFYQEPLASRPSGKTRIDNPTSALTERHWAYGRLHAWRSIAALTGGETETSLAQAERRVRAWAWFNFAGATDWFDKIAWDLGLVALAPDARRLTVLAAPDTD